MITDLLQAICSANPELEVLPAVWSDRDRWYVSVDISFVRLQRYAIGNFAPSHYAVFELADPLLFEKIADTIHGKRTCLIEPQAHDYLTRNDWSFT